MDVEALIAAVFSKPAIWDKRSKLHTNRQLVNRAWTEISNELQQDETALRRKWKYLRDNFVVEYSKRPVSRSGDGASSNPTSKWHYFHQLLFLKDSVKVSPRISTRSLCNLQFPEENQFAENIDDFSSTEPAKSNNHVATTSRDSISESASLCSETVHFPIDDEIIVEDISGLPNEVRARHPGASPAQKRKRGQDRYYDKLIECEERKLQYLFSKPRRSSEEDDRDLMFFKTLLPHVRRIPQHQKLEFQSKIQAVVQEFAYSKEAATADQTPPSEEKP